MNLVTRSYFDRWSFCPEPAPEFRIALVFDAPPRGFQVLHVCRALMERFNDDYLFTVALCPLETFAGPVSAAQRQARSATLIILSTSTLPPLPFWTWLKEWAAEQSPWPRAIGVAVDERATELIAQLQRICQSRDIELVFRPLRSEAESSAPLSVPENAPDENPQLATLVCDLAAANTFQRHCLQPENSPAALPVHSGRSLLN